jgi:hypothetical protein
MLQKGELLHSQGNCDVFWIEHRVSLLTVFVVDTLLDP